LLVNGRFEITAESTQGQAQATTQLPADVAFQDLVNYVQDLIANPADVEQLGEILHVILFPPDVQRLYDSSLGAARGRGVGLRIRLWLNPQQA
jgi:hypothetical protein